MTRPAFLRGGYTTPVISTRPSLRERLTVAAYWLIVWAFFCSIGWACMVSHDWSTPAPVARCTR